MFVRKYKMSCPVASGMALALLLGSAAASAKEVTIVAEAIPEDAISQRVSFADLNLASDAGVIALTGRVRQAARKVCRPLDAFASHGQFAECRSYAWNGAKPQMDRAITRAKQLAATGTTSLAPVAIVIAAPSH